MQTTNPISAGMRADLTAARPKDEPAKIKAAATQFEADQPDAGNADSIRRLPDGASHGSSDLDWRTHSGLQLYWDLPTGLGSSHPELFRNRCSRGPVSSLPTPRPSPPATNLGAFAARGPAALPAGHAVEAGRALVEGRAKLKGEVCA